MSPDLSSACPGTKSLRALEVRVWYIDGAWRTHSSLSAATGLITYVLVTATFLLLSELVVFYRDFDFLNTEDQLSDQPTHPQTVMEAPRRNMRFQVSWV